MSSLKASNKDIIFTHNIGRYLTIANFFRLYNKCIIFSDNCFSIFEDYLKLFTQHFYNNMIIFSFKKMRCFLVSII